MKSLVVRVSRLLGVAVLVSAGVAVQSGVAGASPGAATCHGGSVAPGTYTTLIIAGRCTVDSGNVRVQGNLTVQPGAALNAAFGGSDLRVGGNLVVLSGGILVLGCEPEAFACFNDPDQNVGTLSTNDVVVGNLVGSGALMVLAHNNTIGRSVVDTGGGGGVTCDTQPLGPDGPPAYSTFEDNRIGASASVSGLQTCWLGFIRNTVVGNVNFSNNVTADPDGNEVVTNRIGGSLVCSGDSPGPQQGDSGGSPNVVSGRVTGQCRSLIGP